MIIVIDLIIRHWCRWRLEAVLRTEVVEVGLRFDAGIIRVHVFVVAQDRHRVILVLTPPTWARGIECGPAAIKVVVIVAAGVLGAVGPWVGVVSHGDGPGLVKRR